MKRLRPSGLDLTARRVIMCSLAYYGFDRPLASDRQFDKWCEALAGRFDELDRVRRWQLGSAEEIAITGYHVRVTQAALHGTLSWFDHNGNPPGKVIVTKPWKRSKRYNVDYLGVTDFMLAATKKKRVRL